MHYSEGQERRWANQVHEMSVSWLLSQTRSSHTLSHILGWLGRAQLNSIGRSIFIHTNVQTFPCSCLWILKRDDEDQNRSAFKTQGRPKSRMSYEPHGIEPREEPPKRRAKKLNYHHLVRCHKTSSISCGRIPCGLQGHFLTSRQVLSDFKICKVLTHATFLESAKVRKSIRV